jgi:hypothetical protein
LQPLFIRRFFYEGTDCKNCQLDKCKNEKTREKMEYGKFRLSSDDATGNDLSFDI